LSDEPQIVQRPEQRYVGIEATVPMNRLAEMMPPLFPEVFAWLDERKIAPAGAPFCKYDVIDMARDLVIEVGVPVDAEVTGDTRVKAGVLPAGRYATMTYVGHPDGLERATAQLLAWAEQAGLQWDVIEADDGEHWGSRLEISDSDPETEPDMNLWRTELAFRLKD
jgi:effector-binding domain-containing protein